MYMEFFDLSPEDIYNISRYTDENLLLEIQTREKDNDYCFISLSRFSTEQIQAFWENRAMFSQEANEYEFEEERD